MPVVRVALLVLVSLNPAHQRNASPVRLGENETILLGAVTNRTRDQRLGALQQALRTALDESPFLNIIPAATVTATLKEMAVMADTPLTPEAAAPVCQRAMGKAYVVGSILGDGTGFTIRLSAAACAFNEPLAQAEAKAHSSDQLLQALGDAVTKLRRQLGEPQETVRKFTTPLPRATTSSFEALQTWSAGIKAEQEKGHEAAVPFLETAVKLDPQFAAALFHLGLIYRNTGREALARDFLRKAFAVRERATIRERFNIAGLYYSFVAVDERHAVKTYRQWAKTYPKDERPVSNLGSFYGDVCEYEKAIAQFRAALRINPRNAIVHENLIEILTATSQFNEAREAYREMQRLKLDTDAVHVFMYSVAALEHDAKEAAEQAAWFEDKPQFQHEVLSEQADAEAYAGRLVRARELTSNAVQSALRAGNKEQAAGWQLNSAWREELFGNSQRARQEALHALEIAPDSREGQAMAAIVLVRTGDGARANAIAKTLEQDYRAHATVQSYWLPCIRAQIALARKRPAEALRQLEKARRYDTLFPQVTWYSHMPSIVLRAEAYSALGQPAAAVKEWDQILKHPGIVQLSATAPITRLKLARAAQQAAAVDPSVRARARTAYQEFFSLWKEADPDIPVLNEAKAEFARLT